MIRRVSAWLLVAAVLLFSHSQLASAAGSPGFDLTISPLPTNLTTTPGKTVSTELRVQNSSTNPATIHVSLLKFKGDAETGHPVLLDKEPGDTYLNWVSFSKNDFPAAPGEWNTVVMTINVPDSAAFGYYYAVVFSNGKSPAPGAKTDSASLHGAVASLVLLDVQAPGEKRTLQLASFETNKKLYEFLPVNFTVRVTNTGNVHSQPSGSIYISKGSKLITTLDVNPANGNILPDSTRSFLASWNDGFPHYETKIGPGGQPVTKNGKPVQYLKWDFSKVNHLRFGHYTARLVLVYDDGNKDVPLEATVSFWIIPWRMLALILALILLVVGLIAYVFVLRHRLKRFGGPKHTLRKSRP